MPLLVHITRSLSLNGDNPDMPVAAFHRKHADGESGELEHF
jgi:hypothetical protein